MKVALIPPRGFWSTAKHTNYHLSLACVDSLEYMQDYTEAAQNGSYVIVDNGAAEGELVRDRKLLTRAWVLRAQEIVVPDTMENSNDTIVKANAFWKVCEDEGIKFDTYKFMGVVQSQGDLGGVIQCVEAFKDMPIKVLGIPRHFVDKDKYFRYQVCSWLRGKGLDEHFEVHLLGTHWKHPTEVKQIADAFPWVRGVDTSLPYNYTYYGRSLKATLTDVPGGINRPGGYFDHKFSLDPGLLRDNIETFERWASGTEGTRS